MNMRLKFLLAALSLAAVVLFTGCSALGAVKGRGLFLDQVTRGEVVQPDGTVQEVMLTNKIVNPAVVEALRGAKEANSLVNPTPTAPFVNLGISAALGILGGIATWRNRKNAQRANASEQMNDLFIAGVEIANNPDVKAAIKQLSVQKGLADVVRHRVHKVTGK
jgi:hypothetical protein